MPDQYSNTTVQDAQSGAHVIAPAPTSVTGFIGQALTGPLNQPVRLESFADYQRVFDGLWQHGPMSAAVYDYFENGGQVAVVVRVKAKTCLLRSILQFFQKTRNQNIGFAEIADPSLAANQQGIWAFDQTETLNLLCIPPFAPNLDVDPATWRAALDYCKDRGTFLIIDAPSAWKSVEDLSLGIESINLRDENAAMYFPYLEVADRSNQIQQSAAAPCGMAAGVIARTDRTRGVWKAPAGVEAVLSGDPKAAVALSETDIGGRNCKRISIYIFLYIIKYDIMVT